MKGLSVICHLVRRTLLVCILTLVGASGASAQVDAGFTQYYEVPSYYNPAAVGLTDFLRLRGGTRLQWAGIRRAPKTFLGTADMPLKIAGKKLGVSAVMQQESMGLYDNLTLGVGGAYKLKLFGGELSAGVRVGIFDEGFRGSQVVLPDDNDYHQGTDEAIPTSDVHGTAFDLSAGAYYSRPNWWIGMSATHINQPTVSLSTEGTTAKEYEFRAGCGLYFMAGGNIPLQNTLFEVQPSLLVKSDLVFTTAELTARLRYNKNLYAGLAYRYGDAVALIVGGEYRDFTLGYSFDYPVGSVISGANGSHEVWLGYRMKLDLGEKNRHRHKSIRIM